MGKSTRLAAASGLALATCYLLAFAGVASGAKHVKFRHVLITMSGSGAGNYSWSEPEQDDPPGTCVQPAQQASEVDHYTFGERFKLTFPDGAGNPVGQDLKAGGDELTSGSQTACTNGFGDQLGGTSYNCTVPFTPAPVQGFPAQPTVDLAEGRGHFSVSITGGIGNGPPSGSNCAGVPVGGSPGGFTPALDGKLRFTAAQLERRGSLSAKVGASKRFACSSTSCVESTCDNNAGPGPVPVTCSSTQNYTGELKVQLVK